MSLATVSRLQGRNCVVLLLVIALHVTGICALMTGQAWISSQPQGNAPLTVVFSPRATPNSEPAALPALSLRFSIVPVMPDLPMAMSPETENNTITLPTTDWNALAAEAARQRLEKEQADTMHRNLAGFSDSQLEWSRNNVPPPPAHIPGQSERVGPGGEVISWLSDKCYVTNMALSASGQLQTKKVCKQPPSASKTEMFKDMRRQRDEREKSSIP